MSNITFLKNNEVNKAKIHEAYRKYFTFILIIRQLLIDLILRKGNLVVFDLSFFV
jgi:hypothetical protein